MKKACCTHPGKFGDLLYALPSVKAIADDERYNEVDFCTSEYCRPLLPLLEYQSYINKAYVHPAYKIERMDMGVQPWRMPVDSGDTYQLVVHFGFRRTPDMPLHLFMARQCGIDPALLGSIYYEYPDFKTLDEDYIVMAPRGKTTFESLYIDIIEKSPMKVVQIGGAGDAVGNIQDEKIVDITGLGILETVNWIAKSKGFVGLMSAMLVLANGFDLPRISPHDGKSWDMRHVLYSEYNFYPVNPTAERVWELLLR